MEKIEEFLKINDGDSNGNGYGNGNGTGDGDGNGNGNGDGDSLKKYDGHDVHYIDSIATVIINIQKNIAKGFIINNDLTTTPCCVAKVDNCFAHGKTIKESVCDAQKKALENIPVEKRIKKFLEKFKAGNLYPAQDFFEWHGILTGSCAMGREAFCRDNNIDMTEKYSVGEFIKFTGNAYGADIIKLINY